MSKQLTLLRISGIALGAGLIAFLLFYVIFDFWVLALIVGLTTGIFFAIAGGLVLVNINNQESYHRELERIQHQRARQRVQEEAYQFRRALLQGLFLRFRPSQKSSGVVESELVPIAPGVDEELEMHPEPKKERAKRKEGESKEPLGAQKLSAKPKDNDLPRLLSFKRKEHSESKGEKGKQGRTR